MDIISLLIGIAIGAAFSPFWIKIFNFGKSLVLALVEKIKNRK